MCSPGIFQTTIDLDTGEVGGEPVKIWNGTGGLVKCSILPFLPLLLTYQTQAPEGPHIYQRNGYYYLLIAEGE